VHFGAVEHVLEPAAAHVDVGVDVHSPGASKPLSSVHIGVRTEEHDGSIFDALVDEDFERVGARAGQPIHIVAGVVRFVGAPEKAIVVLEAMKPIDVKIVGDPEERELKGTGQLVTR